MSNSEQRIDRSGRLILGFFILLLVVAIGLYFSGYRLSTKFHIIYPSKIVAHVPKSETNILIDDSIKYTTKVDNETVTIKHIPSGMHTIIFSKKTTWPWKREIFVKGGETAQIEPVQIAENPSGEIIGSNDPEYEFILNHAKEAASINVATSSDSNLLIIKEGNNIKARFIGDLGIAPAPFCNRDSYGNLVENSCTREVLIFEAADKIRNIAFYKGRKDTAIVAVSNGIYAIEITADSFRNFQPIYKGAEPTFWINDKNELFVLDGNSLMEIHW